MLTQTMKMKSNSNSTRWRHFSGQEVALRVQETLSNKQEQQSRWRPSKTPNMCGWTNTETSPTKRVDFDDALTVQLETSLEGGKEVFALCAPSCSGFGLTWRKTAEKRKRGKSVWENFHGRVLIFPHVHLFVCFSLLLLWPLPKIKAIEGSKILFWKL